MAREAVAPEKVEFYLRLPYAVTVAPDSCGDDAPCYMAYHPELPGCMSHGATIHEALANLREVKALYILALLKRDIEPPLPQGGAIYTASGTTGEAIIWQDVSKTLPTGKEEEGQSIKWRVPAA